MVALIRRDIGPVAAFRTVIILDKLPKTRSGKILRYIYILIYSYIIRCILRKIVNG